MDNIRNNRELLCLLAEMTKATRCCQQDAILGRGVTFTQFYILDLVAKNGTLQLFDLHGLLGVEKSTSTRLLEPLVQQELIAKRRSETDYRAIDLVMTEKGHNTCTDLWERVDVFLERLSAEIPVEKQETVYENALLFLNAVKNVLNRNCSEYDK